MKTKKLHTWFLRFYGKDHHLRSKKCLKDIRSRGHKFTVRVGSLTGSVNIFVPMESCEVLLVFRSEKALEKFKSDKLAKRAYEKTAYTKKVKAVTL